MLPNGKTATGHPHDYTFKVRDIISNTNLLNTSTTAGKFTCVGIQASNKVKIEATLPVGRRAKYGIKE